MSPVRRRIGVRLFVTAWLIYCTHFASNVVRETYLAIALGERLSIRVDEFVGLHPDLFEFEGRGAYINSNPGASMLGALPYAAARPALALVFRLRPDLLEPKPASTYEDPRPNRTLFMNEARRRGLDVKLGLAAAVMQVGLMAPLSAAAVVAMFVFLAGRLRDERLAMWLALLYAFGTPVFFRSAFLNQNLLAAHAVMLAFMAVARAPDGTDPRLSSPRLAVAGAALGLAILFDYSGVPMAVAFGLWLIGTAWAEGGPTAVGRRLVPFAAGAFGPILVLMLYQFAAFGNPLFPAQRYMPPTEYSVLGWNGMTLPTWTLLTGNLVDLRYGLFAFSPILAAALAAPLLRERPGGPDRSELWLIGLMSGALYLFNSSNQFANLQFNTGVRYMVPSVPLLFFAAVPVLLRAPVAIRWGLVIATLSVSWSVAMAREDVTTSLARVLFRGFELPWLTVLEKMAAAYAPFLAQGSSPLAIFIVIGAVVWLLWRPERHPSPVRPPSPPPID